MTDAISLIAGDALEKLSLLAPESVDLVIADPPYNLGKDYGNRSDSRRFDDYLDFSRKWLAEASRVLKPTGSIYVFMGVRFISYVYDILLREEGFQFGNWICWHYTQGIGKRRGFSPRHDDILLFHKSKQFTFNLDAIRIPQKYYRSRNNMRGANPGDVWMFSHVHYCSGNRAAHPTQKPEGIIERMVLASSNNGDFVLDPFCGSGTSMRVCQQLQRRGLGIELNSEYVAAAEKRLNREFNGFDSIDPRMNRVPLDMRQPELRKEYLLNHRKWFLKNHENSLELFIESVRRAYGDEVAESVLSPGEQRLGRSVSSYSLRSFSEQLEIES